MWKQSDGQFSVRPHMHAVRGKGQPGHSFLCYLHLSLGVRVSVADFTQRKALTIGFLCEPKSLTWGVIRSGSTQALIGVAGFTVCRFWREKDASWACGHQWRGLGLKLCISYNHLGVPCPLPLPPHPAWRHTWSKRRVQGMDCTVIKGGGRPRREGRVQSKGPFGSIVTTAHRRPVSGCGPAPVPNAHSYVFSDSSISSLARCPTFHPRKMEFVFKTPCPHQPFSQHPASSLLFPLSLLQTQPSTPEVPLEATSP